MTIVNRKVYRILVNTGSSADVIYSEAFEKIGIESLRLRPVKTPLHGFTGDRVISEGAITLPGGCVHIPSNDEGGVGYLRGDQREARRCYAIAVRKGSVKHALTINVLDPRTPTKDPPMEDMETVPLEEADPSKTVQLGSLLNSKQRLNVDPYHKPVKQKRRAFDAERYTAIADEVSKLLSVSFIKEVHYPVWITNVVLVKKSKGKWRVCVDYSDLNKACPKDSFPLPRIDQLLDSTARHKRLSFLDAFSGTIRF
ncbi:uncharacterized protein LOC131249725 [Magnolia sinica]|uniref:uncharacterized protein LOC131249725 n=1 Tax=Magnolia sinica TaxID=86752 RepID=UPI002659EC68|nr:uncharacterized protein LOC131249725 [Magnolia sinica]